MSHIDPEQLALLALGTVPGTPDEEQHLAECDVCRDDLAVLRRTARTTRAALDIGELETPPERVWHRIREDVALADAQPTRRSTRSARRRPGRGWLVGGIAAAAAVAAIVVGVAVLSPRVVAEASLEAFPDHPGVDGSASVLAAGGGETLRVELTGADAPAGFHREVWLLSDDDAAPVSLGTLDGTAGTFTIPVGTDLATHPFVDVSQEPDDSDPSHSGDSMSRGRLQPG